MPAMMEENVAGVGAKAATSAQAQLTTEDFMVPAYDPGIDIFVRNKRPADMRAFRAERTLLFVHGATYPAHTTFDLPVEGCSWMDHIAARGYDVYLLDLRGYGKSTRPPEMAQSPDANPPLVRTETAVKDVAAAVDFILKRRAIPRLVLLGWSWGTFSTPTYAIAHPDKVARLVLYAPIWLGQTGRLAQAEGGRMPAYRTVTPEQARMRWLNGVPESEKATLIPPGAFDAWVKVTMGHRSGWRQTKSAGDPRTQWRDGRRRRHLVGRQALLRSGQDRRAGVARDRRLGFRRAAHDGAVAVAALGQCAEQTPDRAAARHAQRDDGNPPLRAVRRRAGIFGRTNMMNKCRVG